MRDCGLLSLVFSVAMWCAVLPCSAADIYVSQTTQGLGNGEDPADAYSIAWLNTSTNWGSGANQVYNGTTVHFCGTITNSLTMPQGGVAGKPIALHFEPNAKFSAPTWIGAVITAASYVTIDGGSNGVIEATANGSGLTYSNDITGISLAGCSDVTVQNLTIQNLYVHIAGTDENGNAGGGIYAAGVGMSYITVTNCVFHDSYQGFMCAYYAGCSNITMTHCTAYHCNWGGGCGDANSSATLNGLMVDHNHFYSWSNWDDTLDDAHHNGFYAWSTSGWASNVTYAANYVGPGYGAHNTSGMFVSGIVHAFKAYNNIFDASDGTSPADAQLYVWNDTSTTNLVCNNTFIGGYTSIEFYGDPSAVPPYYPTFWKCYNNEFCSNYTCISVFYDNNTNSSHLSDTNNFYAIVSPIYNGFNDTQNGSGNIIPSNGNGGNNWQAYGFDAHSTTNNPNLNASFIPQAGSTLIGAGANLAAFGITTDFAGNSRPATNNWTIGAYQITNSIVTVLNLNSNTPVIAVTPASQAFGMIAVGTETNETFTVQNTGGGTLTGNASVAVPFGIVFGGSYSLAAGQSTNVTVSFSPTVTGANSQVITFSGGGGASAVLSGTGMMPPPQNLQPHALNP